MWLLILLFLITAPAWAESGFPEKYERDSNLFNPAKLFSPDNPLNPAQKYPPPDNTPNPGYR
ncbi:MAG: hypothetical protein KGJ82_18775 [Nitrospirota bacterium]|nr:hypothetical protein [Nitrospirota bacterium]